MTTLDFLNSRIISKESIFIFFYQDSIISIEDKDKRLRLENINFREAKKYIKLIK